MRSLGCVCGGTLKASGQYQSIQSCRHITMVSVSCQSCKGCRRAKGADNAGGDPTPPKKIGRRIVGRYPNPTPQVPDERRS